MSMVGLNASAHDIEVKNADDITIYYNFIKENTELEVTYRGSSFFDYTNYYTGNVVIPESVSYSGKTYSVTSINDHAFFNCAGLNSITIPNSVTSIGFSNFFGCPELISIKVQEGNPVFDSRGECNAIIETTTNTLVNGCKKTLIPNSVTSLGDGAFAGQSELTSITIPNSVTNIEFAAFSGCTKLSSITIPNSVISVKEKAFLNCSCMTSVIMPSSLTTIEKLAFDKCDNLKFVYALSEYPAFVSLKDNSFPMSQSHFKSTLYVKKGLKDLYSQADGWKNFVDIREMTDEEYNELVKKTNGEGETAVKDVSASNINEAKYYSLDGKQFSQPQKGLKILKMSDGTTRKVMK